MNIPKPAIWIGLVALIGVYVSIQPRPEAAHDESEHTHEDGTKHSGAEHSEGEGSSAPSGPTAPNATKLQVTDVVKGTGAEALPGKHLRMHYRGTLTSGKQFDSSYDKGTPFDFTLGQGEVIPGWDQGIKGMKVGGKRKLVIPPDLGYGDKGAGQDIPPGATLLFDVELLDVK